METTNISGLICLGQRFKKIGQNIGNFQKFSLKVITENPSKQVGQSHNLEGVLSNRQFFFCGGVAVAVANFYILNGFIYLNIYRYFFLNLYATQGQNLLTPDSEQDLLWGSICGSLWRSCINRSFLSFTSIRHSKS